MPRNIRAEQSLNLQEKEVLVLMATDIAAIRTALIGVNLKLDNDLGVTDTNYTALFTPAALNVVA